MVPTKTSAQQGCWIYWEFIGILVGISWEILGTCFVDRPCFCRTRVFASNGCAISAGRTSMHHLWWQVPPIANDLGWQTCHALNPLIFQDEKYIILYWCVGLFQREKPERARKGDTTWCKPWEEFVGWFVHSCSSNPNIRVALMFNYCWLVVIFCRSNMVNFANCSWNSGLNVRRISQHQVILAIVSRIKPCEPYYMDYHQLT